MMSERIFGRRGAALETKTRVLRTEITEPVEVVLVKRKGLTPGRIVLAVVGLMVGYNIVAHANQGDADPDGSSATVTPAVTKTAKPHKCGATLREYQALQTGITLGQAIGIIGCSGEEISRVSYGGQETVMVSWPGETGFFGNMNATFDNDRLVAKGQLGLE
jgi:hypothetical protein